MFSNLIFFGPINFERNVFVKLKWINFFDVVYFKGISYTKLKANCQFLFFCVYSIFMGLPL